LNRTGDPIRGSPVVFTDTRIKTGTFLIAAA
jgi:hypothetical protein